MSMNDYVSLQMAAQNQAFAAGMYSHAMLMGMDPHVAMAQQAAMMGGGGGLFGPYGPVNHPNGGGPSMNHPNGGPHIHPNGGPHMYPNPSMMFPMQSPPPSGRGGGGDGQSHENTHKENKEDVPDSKPASDEPVAEPAVKKEKEAIDDDNKEEEEEEKVDTKEETL